MQSRQTLVRKKIELVCTFFHFPLVSVPVHCRLWNVEEGGVQKCGL